MSEDSHLIVCLYDKALLHASFSGPNLIKVVKRIDLSDFWKLFKELHFLSSRAKWLSLHEEVTHFAIYFLFEHIFTMYHAVHNLTSHVPG